VAEALERVQNNESPENMILLIKKVAEKKERAWAELVVEYGIQLFGDGTDILKIENFKVLEEVFFASLECKAFDWADIALLKINDHIPKAPKAVRYLAMFHEAKGDDEKAKNLYRECIKANPEDTTAYRRLSAYLRDSDLLDEAIETLNKALKMDISDVQIWFELSELYIAHMDYKKAAYWFEEIMIHKPSNYLYNIKYAEILYSIGGGDNFTLARKYYSKAIALNDKSSNNSVRAIWGLLETWKRLESLGRKYQDEVNEELVDMCKDKLGKIYSQVSKLDIEQLK
jgi:tetratricopeptide (TPR) repeat protein